MRTYYCDHFVLPLPEGHRFPMEKYALLRERLSGEPGIDLRVPDGASDRQLERVHTAAWVAAVMRGELDRDAVRRIGFPWSEGLVERSRRSVGGTIAAGRAAVEEGRGANLAGGTHHAFPDRAGGFCVFNDVAVAIRALQAEGRIVRAAVLDLDVHQGDGTAAIFRDDPAVFTASVHGARNYPFEKRVGDLDVPLPDGAGDDPFLDAVDRSLAAALGSDPDVLFYLAGADAYAGDRLGRLAVSRDGLAERDHRVVRGCARAGVPLAVVMSGGYAEDVRETVEIHAHSVLAAARPTDVAPAGSAAAGADAGDRR